MPSRITSGVLKRLAKLTTINNKNKNLTMDEIYPIHAEALSKAGLLQSFPTLADVYSKIKESNRKKTVKEKSSRSRENYFCIGVSNAWSTPVHTSIKELRDKFKLMW